MTNTKPLFPQNPDLSPLHLGTREQVLSLLDSLYREGEIQAVIEWAQKELQPGRQIFYSRNPGEELQKAVIYDRSIWHVDDQGQPTTKPLLEPLTDEEFGESELFAVWSRPFANEPFLLRLRTRVTQNNE